MDPFQARRARFEILEWWPAGEHDLHRLERAVALIEAGRRILPVPEIYDLRSTAAKWREARHRTIL